MDKQKDLVVHRFRRSGKVDIIRLSSSRILGRLILWALILVAATAGGSFLLFMHLFPQRAVLRPSPEPAREKPAAKEIVQPPLLREETARQAPKPAAEAPGQIEEEGLPSPPAEITPAPPAQPPDVDIGDFRMTEERDGMLVSLTVNNAREDGSLVSGYVVMVLTTKDGRTLTYPDVGLDREGNPAKPRKGRRFAIKRLIVLNAKFNADPEDALRVSVYYYDPQGKLRMTKDFEEFGKPTGGPS